MFKGLFFAILLHGLYDYFLFSTMGIGLFALVSLLVSYRFAKKVIQESQDNSRYNMFSNKE